MIPALIFGGSALVGLGFSIGQIVSVWRDFRALRQAGTDGVLRVLIVTDLGNEGTRGAIQAIMVAVTIVSLLFPRAPSPPTVSGRFVTYGLVAVSILTLVASLHSWQGRRRLRSEH